MAETNPAAKHQRSIKFTKPVTDRLNQIAKGGISTFVDQACRKALGMAPFDPVPKSAER